MNSKTITLLFAILITFANTSFTQTKQVLFLGNSYIYYNDGLPIVFKEIATSMGDVVEVESNTPGGTTFADHSTNSTSLSLIQSRDWDYVVLQGQSQEPSFPPSQVATQTYPYAKILCDSIHNNSSCSIPLFFMTWGRENGDAGNCAVYPPICTYLGMQWRLRQSYVEMAEDNEGWVSPVGMVWKSIRESNPEIDLYQADESHPSDNGTYVAACTFYASIFHKSPVGAYHPTDVSAENAAIIQAASWNVFADSLDIWLVDTTTLRVDFEPHYLVKSAECAFSNLTENADSCLWVFGDGSQEIQYPIWDGSFEWTYHSYPTIGIYEVCLKAYKRCETKEICKDINITYSENLSIKLDNTSIYPNPTSNGILNITHSNKKDYQIISIDGKIVSKGRINDNKINISSIKSGNYILQIEDTKIRFSIITNY